MSLPNSPIVNAGLKYVNGLQIYWADTRKIVLEPGACRDSLNINDIILSSSVIIDGSKVGANGVDLATLEIDKFYAVYVISASNSVDTSSSALGAGYDSAFQPVNVAPAPANPLPTAGLLSLDPVSPKLPYGYDSFRRIGWVRTNGTAVLLPWFQFGNSNDRKYYYQDDIQVLTAGASATFAAVDLSSAVPPIASEISFNVALTGAADAEFLPYFAVPPTDGIIKFAAAGAATCAEVIPCDINAGKPTIMYKVSANALNLFVAGYVDYLG